MVGEHRRYEIFISSTSKDLKEERETLIRTTLKCGHFPSAMELFTVAGAPTVEHIEDCISKADLFVILVGARYGAEVKGLGKTYTELEYEFAIKYEKPILAFLLSDEEYARERGKLKEGDPERKHDDDLRAFRESVKQYAEGVDRHVQFFELEKKGELAEKYALALPDEISKLGGKQGWVRGELYDGLKTKISLGETVSENPFFQRFVDRLNAFDVLSDRCVSKVPHLKRAIANFFLDMYLARIIDAGVRNLFFESGSSIAFLSEAFVKRLLEDWMRKVSPDLRIQTNNILTYLDFVLSERIQVELYPYGPPEKKYGATFGPLTAVPEREYPTHPRLLSKAAREAIEEICDWLIKHYKDRGIILMAASGVDLSKESEFPGLHVGSYYNKLFKRAILAAACPTIIFLDETKMPQEFKIGKCFSVCDEEMTWSSVCQTNPLAIAVATSTKEKAKELERLSSELTLCHVEAKYEDTCCTLIASNEHFQNLWR